MFSWKERNECVQFRFKSGAQGFSRSENWYRSAMGLKKRILMLDPHWRLWRNDLLQRQCSGAPFILGVLRKSTKMYKNVIQSRWGYWNSSQIFYAQSLRAKAPSHPSKIRSRSLETPSTALQPFPRNRTCVSAEKLDRFMFEVCLVSLFIGFFTFWYMVFDLRSLLFDCFW